MRFQCYATDGAALVHAGIIEVTRPTKQACRNEQAKWLLWRRENLRKYSGNFPLRTDSTKVTEFRLVSPITGKFFRTISLLKE